MIIDTGLHSEMPVPVIMTIDKSALLIQIVAAFHVSLRHELVSM